jgi:hypothetical protein
LNSEAFTEDRLFGVFVEDRFSEAFNTEMLIEDRCEWHNRSGLE